MSKNFYCARCGKKLKVIPKAIPHKGIIMNLVEPHVCKELFNAKLETLIIDDPESGKEISEEVKNKYFPSKEGAFKILDGKREGKLDKKIGKLFDEFPFAKKLNKTTAEHEVVTQESGDKRNKKDLREELVTSTAPNSILGMATKVHTSPVRELKETER